TGYTCYTPTLARPTEMEGIPSGRRTAGSTCSKVTNSFRRRDKTMPQPLQYMALAYRDRHLIPLTLLPAMVHERCADCGQKVLAHAAMLRATRTSCKQHGQRLRVVCETCGERNLRQADESFLFTPDTTAQSHFRRG